MKISRSNEVSCWQFIIVHFCGCNALSTASGMGELEIFSNYVNFLELTIIISVEWFDETFNWMTLS